MSSVRSELRLVVFADDWGRHPSSCQHLVRHLSYQIKEVTWVNTIGTRPPSLSTEDLAKIGSKLQKWLSPKHQPAGITREQPHILSPMMYPGFRSTWQRKTNAWLISSVVNKHLGLREADEKRIAVTTIPVTADLIRTHDDVRSKLDVDHWIYYCVDDFSVWPGLDSDVMRHLEALQLARVDTVVTSSQALSDRIEVLQPNSQPTLMTHGIDAEHWANCESIASLPADVKGPYFLFWGLIDQRLSVEFCRALAKSISDRKQGCLVFVGPQQSPADDVMKLPNTRFVGKESYAALPAYAKAADVLVMPYSDSSVTRQMQPLKFKEYLATGKPVVATQLPSNEGWGNACDLVATVDEFVDRCWQRAELGLPVEQAAERTAKLQTETWKDKAGQFLSVIDGLTKRPATQ